MPTYNREFKLGLLPEKRWDWRTFAASYGLVTAFILLLAFFGVLVPGTLIIASNYHVTELIPLPSMRPERAPKPKPLPVTGEVVTARSGVPGAETDRAA